MMPVLTFVIKFFFVFTELLSEKSNYILNELRLEQETKKVEKKVVQKENEREKFREKSEKGNYNVKEYKKK